MKSIITVLGTDKVGIIAKVCNYLAETNVNILDISQTIVAGYFNMMMIVDISNPSKSFEIMSSDLENIGNELGVVIKMQHEDIFNCMHRI
ncbi:MAG TPA: ACT domain-containing protein [Candidatus Fimicola cottocaccae]|nr:ACT domain-containing protein [Candidatus Fimicola cottocaccae]